MQRVTPLLAIAAILLLLPATVAGTPALMTVSAAAARYYAELANDLADRRNAALGAREADKIRTRLRDARKEFVAAMEALDAELARLRQNPEQNKALIARLEAAKEQSGRAREDLKRITALMAEDRVLLNAVRSGTLERVVRQVAEAMGGSHRSIAAVEQDLRSTGDEKTGFVTIDRIEPRDGRIAFYITTHVPGKGVSEVRVEPGRQYPVRQLPIVIRACVVDHQKEHLARLQGEQVVGRSGSVEFLSVEEAFSPGHRFRYRGAPGTTTWTAEEKYTWKPDPLTRTKLRGLSQRGADAVSQRSTGDLVEIHTTSAVAQGLAFEVTGEVRWNRETVLNGRTTRASLVPKNSVAGARIVLSLFPN